MQVALEYLSPVYDIRCLEYPQNHSDNNIVMIGNLTKLKHTMHMSCGHV